MKQIAKTGKGSKKVKTKNKPTKLKITGESYRQCCTALTETEFCLSEWVSHGSVAAPYSVVVQTLT